MAENTCEGLAAKILLFVIVTLVAGCSVQSGTLLSGQHEEKGRTIFLVSHGWHAGVVVKRIDIQHPDWPEIHTFASMEYLEIGWGDRGYYTSPDPGVGLAAKALLLPTSSVLHLAGFRGPPENYFPYSEIIRIELSGSGFEQMIDHVAKSFARDEHGTVVYLGPGNYGGRDSRFYASSETYHLCKTCNTWTATILQAAGCPVSTVVTAKGLMARARVFGEVIQANSESD